MSSFCLTEANTLPDKRYVLYWTTGTINFEERIFIMVLCIVNLKISPIGHLWKCGEDYILAQYCHLTVLFGMIVIFIFCLMNANVTLQSFWIIDSYNCLTLKNWNFQVVFHLVNSYLTFLNFLLGKFAKITKQKVIKIEMSTQVCKLFSSSWQHWYPKVLTLKTAKSATFKTT